MKKDETVEEFAERLRQLACGMPETTTDNVLLQRLSDGLPSALKFNALAVTGEFDTVDSQVGQSADTMAALRPRREQENAVGGAVEHTNGKRKVRAALSGRATKSGPATAPSPVGIAKTLSDSTLTTPKTSDPGIARASVFDVSSGDT
jgi:hypothetical protein